MLDDVVLEGTDALGRAQFIEYQIKRTIEVIPSDRGFADVVARCLGELSSDDGSIADGLRAFGLLSRPNGHLEHLERIVRYARAHDNPDSFLNVLRSTASREVRDRLDHIRAAVANVLPEGTPDAFLDEMLWRFCRALHVWKLDAEPDTDDLRGVVDRLADLVHEPVDPVTVFDELVSAAAEWAPTAASVDVNMVRARLERRGVALDAAPRQRASFEALAASSVSLLDPSLARIGRRLHLPRWAIRREVEFAVGDAGILLLAGRAGVGKSVLARLVAHDLRARDASVLAVNLAGRTGRLSTLEQDLGGSLAAAMAGAPLGGLRVLLLDGAEQALTDAGALLSSILTAVPLEQDNVPPWCLMLTARDEAIPTITRLIEDRAGVQPVLLRISELTDDEIAEVVSEFPQLAATERNARSRALLLRRPYIVELLVRAVSIADLPADVVGEEHVIDIVDKRLVRLDDGGLPGRGAPYARADIYRALGSAVIGATTPAPLHGTDPEARAGLASDDLITETRSRWRFAHDVLADYSAASVLLETEGAHRLRSAPAIRRLLRSARLKMQCQLAEALKDGRLQEVWTAVRDEANALAEVDGPRWLDVPWEALLQMGKVRDALAVLQPSLFAHDGTDLGTLLVTTERQARRAAAEDVEGVVPLDPYLSGPVVDFLVAHSPEVPSRWTALAPKLVHEHLDAAASAGLAPGTGLAGWPNVPAAVIRWADADQYGDRLEHAIGALSLCGPHLTETHTDFLVEHARRRPNEIEEPVESPRATAHLAESRPDVLLRLAGFYYLGRGLRLTGEDEETGDRPSGRRSCSFEEDREGVRDHSRKFRRHLPMWPLGNNQSNPALGPFAALLQASPAHGLRLIGEVVDTATAARSRLEAGFDRRRADPPDDALALELNAAQWDAPRRFSGPATVWLWFRRTGTGPDPALSALMALRAWGVARLRDGDLVHEVRDDILAAGTSFAFVAVALSALVDAIDRVVDELDPFLTHPLIWHLEIARSTHEHGGTALDVPDANHLAWNMSNVAVLLVLRANTERRLQLRALGEQLVANSGELSGTDSELVTRRWAAELDVDRFVAQPRDEGIEISVTYPEGVLEALQENGGDVVALSMRLTGVMFAAVQARDGKADLDTAVEVWADAVAGCQERAANDDEYGVYSTADIMSAAGSALVLAAAANHEVPDEELRRAVAFLIEGANFFGQSAPPPAGDVAEATDDDGERDPFRVPDMAWDMGADRSIATALPILVMRGDLRVRAHVTIDDLEAALVALACSPFDETRTRLVNSLLPCLEDSCADATDSHRIAVSVARRLVATQGRERRSGSYGHGYRPVLLPEPLEATIDAATDILLDDGSASFAVWLLAACKGDCEHELQALRLLDALIEYDRRVWPAHYARHHYHRSGLWRRAIDVVLADRILDGDDSVLDQHLTAFAHVADELKGFLEALPMRADTEAKVERLHDVWPQILDRFLPEFRDLRTVGGTRDGEPWLRDVEDLDRALLLMIPDNASWPVERNFKLGARWLAAYQGVPHVADRAIFYVGRTMGLRNDVAVQVILRTMGNEPRTILRESQYAVAWLQAVLADPPEGEGVRLARALLDRMAATGDEDAIRAQQALEA